MKRERSACADICNKLVDSVVMHDISLGTLGLKTVGERAGERQNFGRTPFLSLNLFGWNFLAHDSEEFVSCARWHKQQTTAAKAQWHQLGLNSPLQEAAADQKLCSAIFPSLPFQPLQLPEQSLSLNVNRCHTMPGSSATHSYTNGCPFALQA